MGKPKDIKIIPADVLKDTRIIIFFTYLLLLLIVCFISYKLYLNKRIPLSISSENLALYQNKSNLPENTFLDLHNTTYDKLKLEIDIIKSMKYCDNGQCVLDIKTGIKRCPDNKNAKLLFNASKELCTEPYSCPDSQPYAVQSTGETVLKTCEEGIPCRCIVDKYCAPYVSQVLEITDGNPWIKNNSYKNFFINPLTTEEYQGFTLDPLVIKSEDAPTNYCKINPEFTQRLLHGCVFNINSGEPMDCENGSYLILDDAKTQYTVYNTTFDLPSNDYYTDTLTEGAYTPSKDELYLYNPDNAWDPDHKDRSEDAQTYPKLIPPKIGIMLVVGTSNDYFTYNGIERIAHKFTISRRYANSTPSDYTHYTNLVIKLNNVRFNGKPGLPSSLVSSSKLELQNVYYKNCIKSTFPEDNYKNMLNCVQDDFQPCITGQLAYNVDDGNARSFAQFNGNNIKLGDREKTIDNYLMDPSFYTMSCVNGGGCSKTIDLSLCEQGTSSNNCIDAYDEKKSKFYAELDDSALSSEWVLENTNPTNGFSEKYTYEDSNKQITINTHNTLLTLENGDYWSLFSNPINAYGMCNFPAGTSVFTVNNSKGVTKDMEVSYDGMCTIAPISVVTAENNSITLSEPSDKGTCFGQPFIFYNNLNNDQYGVISNCTTDENGLQTCTLSQLLGKQPAGDMGVSPIINIYKQFGFNGINYNTFVNTDDGTKNNLRLYSESSIINVNSELFNSLNSKSPPLNMLDFLDSDDIDYNNNFKDPFALFKNFNSMYYPVWNNNTFKQECIVPKPFIVSYPAVSETSNSDNSISRIPIQFSGKHFGQYCYHNNDFYFNTFSVIKKKLKITDLSSSNQLIVLDKPNEDISIGNTINDSNCNFDVYFVPEKETSYDVLGGISIQIQISEDVQNSVYNTQANFASLEDKYKTFTYNNVSYPDSKSYIISTDNGKTFNFLEAVNKNYFIGKVYSTIYEDKVYYFSMKSRTKVTNIDNNLVETNSYFFNQIQNDSLIQFLDTTEVLGLGLDSGLQSYTNTPGSGCSFHVNGITQGRITNIKIDNSGSGYLSDNLPFVVVKKYKLNKNGK